MFVPRGTKAALIFITGTMSNILWLRSICSKNGIGLSEEQGRLLGAYVSLLLRFTQQVNLISRKDEENVWERHILHSIAPLFKLTFADNLEILDLGTGGGLPGVPLKILLPTSKFTLVDSIQKKVTVVDKIIYSLGLQGISVVCSRAEDLPKNPKFKHGFDVVIARAVAPLKHLVRWSDNLVKRDFQEPREESTANQVTRGMLVVYKGGNLEKEIFDVNLNTKVKAIEETPLVFHGSESLALMDKKIVLVKFSA